MEDSTPMEHAGAVWNQPPPLEDYNLYEQDTSLREALHREGGGWIEPEAPDYGTVLGSAETLRLGELANDYPPVLRTHDRFGNRIDEVELHHAWHELMKLGVESATHSLPWTSNRRVAHVARAAMMMLRHQVDEGPSCPLTMTFAVVPSLRLQPELAAEWEPKVVSNEYDSRFIPAAEKREALVGMAMTERQGQLEGDLCDGDLKEVNARRLAESIALALQGALFIRHAPPAVADAFCASRLASDGAQGLGTLATGTDFDALIERARPRIGVG